jgi:hypothetical protein
MNTEMDQWRIWRMDKWWSRRMQVILLKHWHLWEIKSTLSMSNIQKWQLMDWIEMITYQVFILFVQMEVHGISTSTSLHLEAFLLSLSTWQSRNNCAQGMRILGYMSLKSNSHSSSCSIQTDWWMIREMRYAELLEDSRDHIAVWYLT